MARRKISQYVARFIFRTVCFLLIATVVGIIAWRILSSGVPTEMKTLVGNEKLSAAYNENGGNLNIFYQGDLDNITRTEYNSGYFSVHNVAFIDEAEQLQVVVRHNKSTLENLKEDLKLPEADSRDEDVFDIQITVMYDLTPENKADNDGNTPSAVKKVTYRASESTSMQKNLYNYKKYVVDGIKITDDVIAVYVDIFYDKDVMSEGTLCIYDYRYPRDEYKLTNKDLAEISRLNIEF